MEKDSARKMPSWQRASAVRTLAIEESCSRSILQHQCVGSREGGLSQPQNRFSTKSMAFSSAAAQGGWLATPHSKLKDPIHCDNIRTHRLLKSNQ